MDKLPYEIVSEVFSHIEDRRDIASLRSVQLAFAKIGRPSLFNEITIQPTFLRLNELLEISRKDFLATHVKTVTVHINHISETVLDSYKRAKVESIQSRAPGISAHVEEIRSRLSLFNSCAIALYDFQKSPDMGVILNAAIAHLPNLKALNFVDGPERLSPISTIRQMRGVRRYFSSLLPNLRGFTGSAPDMSFWGEQYSLRCFMALISAAYFSKKRLCSFKSKVLIDSTSFQKGVYDSHIMVRMLNAFKGCQEIELWFYTERGGRGNIPADLKNHLFKVLSPAKKLKKLTLNFGIDMKWTNVRAPFNVIFGDDYVWPCLQEFNIAGFGIKDCDLLEFLKRHRMTLRKVGVMNCELYTGSWCAVVKSIKEILQLTSFELGSELLDDGDTYSDAEIEEMKDYVLCTGEWVRPFSRRVKLIETQIWREKSHCAKLGRG